MKKLLILMAIMAAFMLTACGGNKNENLETDTNIQQSETNIPENEDLTEEIDKVEEEIKTDNKQDNETQTQKPQQQKPQDGQQAQQQKPQSEQQKPQQQAPEQKPEQKPQTDNRSLAEIMSSIITGLGELPKLMEQPLDESNFSFFAFADYVEGAEGYVSEPMMSSFAHSVVLVRLPDGADVNAFARQMRDKADPRKWICVEAEEVKVSTKGNLVLLVMSSKDNVSAITSNFLKG